MFLEILPITPIIEITGQASVSEIDDTEAPTRVTNLAAPSSTSSSVTLTWTAPSDNVYCTGYDIRYGTTAVSSLNWSTKTQAINEPTPGVPGTAETFVVTGLTSNTTYYFGLKTHDAVSNMSSLSNTVSKKTTA